MAHSSPLFSQSVKEKIYTQGYGATKQIDGVKVVTLKTFAADEGDFGEILRLNESGALEQFEGFHLRQVNRTTLFPKSIKAWHVHEHQDEIWYLAPHDQLTVGLWDLRDGSASEGVSQKVVLGGGHSRMLFIPKGVAHGSANFSPNSVDLWYFVNQQFNVDRPDENRIQWDELGAEFWTPERD